jgi:hypothetical protein
VEPAQIIAVIPEVLRAWRAMTFDAEHVVETETGPREGLRVVAGVHPRPGVRYRVVARPDSSDDAPAVHVFDVLEDDRERVRLSFASSSRFTGTVELTYPARPQRFAAEIATPTVGGCLVGGPATVVADIDLGALAAGHGDQDEIEVRVRHRRVQGRAEVRVNTKRDGSSHIEIKVKAGGRGVLRPVIALASLLVNRRFKQQLREGAAKTAMEIEQMAAAARREFGPDPDPADVATKVLAAFMDDVAERAPARLPGDDSLPALPGSRPS